MLRQAMTVFDFLRSLSFVDSLYPPPEFGGFTAMNR